MCEEAGIEMSVDVAKRVPGKGSAQVMFLRKRGYYSLSQTYDWVM